MGKRSVGMEVLDEEAVIWKKEAQKKGFKYKHFVSFVHHFYQKLKRNM